MITKINTGNTSKKRILFLSIPIFFSNLAVPFIGIIDTGLMGNLGETKYLAAVSIGSTIMAMVVWSFGFLRMGTVGIIAQLFAKSDYREIIRTIIRNFFLAITIAILIIILTPIIIKLTNNFFQISSDTLELAKIYITVRAFSAPAELILYVIVGFYLGIQKTNISSLIIITMSILNIIISSFCVLTLDLNVFGVALGTLIANYVTMSIFLYVTYKFIFKKFQIIPTLNKLIISSKFIKLLTVNYDIFLRSLFLTFSFLWFAYLGSKIGEDFLAINTILLQFVILASFLLDAFAFSTEGIIGFAIGRKNKKSFLSAVKNSIELSFFSALILSILYLLFFKFIINILTDVDVLRFISYKHAIWIILIPPLASFCYQLDGIFIGASQTKDMRNGMIISVFIYVIISIYLIKFFDNHGLWLSLLIFMSLRALTLRYFFSNILRKF